jgi:hypothetical protein
VVPAAATTRPTTDYAGEARPTTSDSRAPGHDQVNPAANRLPNPLDPEKSFRSRQILPIGPGFPGTPGKDSETR